MILIIDTPPFLNISVLHSFANQCYNLDNENKYSLIHQSPTIASSEGIFVGVAICHLFLLRLLSQWVKNAMAQPLMTGAMMWTKISITLYTSSLRQIDAWGIGDLYIISSPNIRWELTSDKSFMLTKKTLVQFDMY